MAEPDEASSRRGRSLPFGLSHLLIPGLVDGASQQAGSMVHLAGSAAAHAGSAAAQAGSALAALARTARPGRRGVWSGPGRHHIEVHGVAQPGGERLARRVEEALERLDGVAWARVNAPSGRVVVAVTPPEPPLSTLTRTITEVERTDRFEPSADVDDPHPPEEGPRTRRALSTIAADAVGLGLSALTRVVPLTPAPGEIAGLVNAVDLHPRLHELAGRGLRGDHRADRLFPLVEAVVQGLTGGWAAIVLDGAQRALQWAEARAQLAAWERAEPHLAGTPECAAAPATAAPHERPRKRPDGPVERYASRVLTAGAAAGLVAAPLLGRKRATALSLAALPKAATAAREGYSTYLGRVLAQRGVVVMERTVLRLLDRVDTLVLDDRVLVSDQGVLTDLVPLPGADSEQVAGHAFDLFDASQPEALHSADDWSLGPIDRLSLRGRTGAREVRRLSDGGGIILGLAHVRVLQAVIRVDRQAAPGMQTLLSAARDANLRLVVASEDERRYAFADKLVPGGPRLRNAVRAMQEDGATVMVLSADRRVLSAADCGIGVCATHEPPPWGAHLLVGPELELPAQIVRATGTARTVARQGIALSATASGLGTIAALSSPVATLPNRVATAYNTASGLALAAGVWQASRLRPPTAAATEPTAPWHLMPVGTVLTKLGTSAGGLADEEAARRLRTGHDGGDANAPTTFLRAFVDELANPLTPVLAAGAGLSAAVGSVVDAGLVAGVVGVSALIGAAHRSGTERSLAELLSRSAVTARVRRDGAERMVPAAELVPGDVIVVEPGDAVPADCRVIETAGLEADESSLTGESLPVEKTRQPVIAAAVADRRSMLYEGTTIAAGRGLAVVVATGAETEVGRGMALAGQATPKTGVESRLSGLTKTSIPLAIGSAVAVAGAGLLRGIPMAQTAAAAANLAVASVPEGLPFLVSAAQLAAARRLAEHRALVRNPRTIETLGRVDVLCFDKTGTLTEGQLKLAGVGDGDHYTKASGVDERLRPVLAAALRATPRIDEPEELIEQTDRAVVLGAQRCEVRPDTGAEGWSPAGTLPFEPSRGYHATVGRVGQRFLLSVKGAPETILPRCDRRRLHSGDDQPLDEQGRQRLVEVLSRHAGAGHRVLAVAERDVDGPELSDDAVRGLVFVGLLTLADGVRESAAPAVRKIRDAGVHTIMITGDHPATAAAIAAVISPDDAKQRVTTGTELNELDDEALGERLVNTDVVARCTPAHKVRIIQALQRCGRTVAMTGDGANDAPAIRLADVGIALGQRGTPAARAAADLVVTDDRLETIIATLVEGRAMWSSVRHALSILVGGNLGEIAFSVLTAAVTGRSALNGRQLLLVNLLTDLAPAMAIAVRPPRHDAADELLKEGPDASLGETLTREMTLRAASTAIGATAGWTVARFTGFPTRASTVALASLVGTQLGQTLVTGGVNPQVLLSTLASVGALVVVIQTPGVSQFFGCTPLGPLGWTIATGSAVGATLGNVTIGRMLAGAEPRPPGESHPEGRSGESRSGQGHPGAH